MQKTKRRIQKVPVQVEEVVEFYEYFSLYFIFGFFILMFLAPKIWSCNSILISSLSCIQIL